jgi:hypothetical protein
MGDDSGQTTDTLGKGFPFPGFPTGKLNNTLTNKEEEVTP